MKALSLIAVVLLFASGTRAQPATVTSLVQRTRAYGHADSIQFPRVQLATSNATTRANLTIEEMLFDGIASEKGIENLIKANAYTKGRSGITSLRFVTLRNDGLLLTIGITAETEAAYPDNFDRSITLDATTGNIVTARDILTPAGYQKFKTRIALEDRTMIARDSVDILKEDSTSMEDIRATLDQLNGCLDTYDVDPIVISETAIATAASNCLPHVARAIDLGWSVSTPIASLATDLSEYGRSILIEKKPHTLPPLDSAMFQLYRGTIGTQPITMMIKNTDGTDNLQFFYDDQATTTTLSSGWDGNAFKAGTFEKAGAQETFDGTLKNGTITGTWRKGKKSLPFELHPY